MTASLAAAGRTAACLQEHTSWTQDRTPRCNTQNRPDGGPWDPYFWVHDARKLFDQVKAAGAKIAYGPILQAFYGNWEFAVRDIDGHLFAFGSDAGQA